MEIYLTKMILNTQSRKVWNDLGNPQQLHRTVSGAFPKIDGQERLPHHERKTPRGEFNLLHRLEFDRSTGKAVLLVQSSVRPDWSSLGEEYADRIESKTLHDKYARIADGMNLRFRLQANPTKRIGKSDEIADARFRDPDKRRRVDIRTDEGRIAWLRRKGEEAGFELANVKVAPVPNVASVAEGKVNFRKQRNSPRITFGSVVFEGVLQVTDAAKFGRALVEGIGQGKAYGFGLLSVALSTAGH